MYLNIVCLNQVDRNYFYLLPLRLLLLPLNKNGFSNIVEEKFHISARPCIIVYKLSQ